MRQIAATRRSNKFCHVNKRILLQILSPRQNFVAATCRTKSNWFNFVRHVAATKFCRGDKILIYQASNVEPFTPGDLSLQPIAVMSACDLAFDCTHKAICCSNVLQRFFASCVPALKLRLRSCIFTFKLGTISLKQHRGQTGNLLRQMYVLHKVATLI